MKSALWERLEPLLPSPPQHAEPLSGGCIAEVYAVTLANGDRVVVKTGSDTLALEARMLDHLAEQSDLPVPAVRAAEDDLLVLEHLPGTSHISKDAERHAADLLANLHSTPAPHYGFTYDTLVGSLPQPNPPTDDWVAFFRDQRLLYMADLAHRAERLPSSVYDRLKNLAENLHEHLDTPAHPSLIHGDIWSGNVLAEGGRITGLLDPALYYADAEIELAFIALFNTFGDAFFDRYQEHRPIRDGFFEQRKDLYNLYPLLVHVRLFGGSYLTSVTRTLDRLGY
ncbi:MAG: fructosamine kinase family protein [Trueperaceae bacterium]|nr:fructosamine kinase family protein [Trueperaceae bacterium]